MTTDTPKVADAPAKAGMTIDAILLEIIGHLGAAQIQRIAIDDEIIAGHIDVAHGLAVLARRMAAETPLMLDILRTIEAAATRGNGQIARDHPQDQLRTIGVYVAAAIASAEGRR